MSNQFQWDFTSEWTLTEDEWANFLIDMHEAKKKQQDLFSGPSGPVTVALKPESEINWSELI